MDEATRPAKQKLVANVWVRLIDPLARKVESACLVRDSFLDLIFQSESNKVRTEVAGANPDKNREFIEVSLAKLPKKPVSFALLPSTVRAINQACADLNLPRDAFVNRILLLLLLTPAGWSRFLDVSYDNYVAEEIRGQGGATAVGILGLPLLDAIEASTDPFWGPRWVLASLGKDETSYGLSLSEIEMGGHVFGGDMPSDEREGIFGLNCCLTVTDPNPETLEPKSFDILIGELLPEEKL